LNRQAERYGLEGVPIALSTMADAAGTSAKTKTGRGTLPTKWRSRTASSGSRRRRWRPGFHRLRNRKPDRARPYVQRKSGIA